MEPFAAYGHAIVSIALWALVVLLLSPISALAKSKAGLVPGAAPQADYTDPVYRLYRSQQNSAENLAVFAAVTFAAMLAGASPFWVNWLASVAFVARLVMVFVHIQGIGKPRNGARTVLFVFGWALHAVLAVLAIFAAF